MSYSEAQYVIDELAKTGNGLFPDPVVSANASKVTGGVALTFTPPDDTIVNIDVPLAYIDRVVIVRKENSAPTSINDGTVVASISRDYIHNYETEPIVDNVDTSKEWYYAFYTVSDQGVVNKQGKICIVGLITRFAYHHDFTDLNPDTCITYLNWGDLDSTGTRMHTNSSTGTVTYGSFEDLFILKKNKPYMVGTNFQADYALDPDDYTKKLDGSASDVSNTSYSGLGAYAWIPKFYMKEVYAQDGNSRDVYFSMYKEDVNFYPIGFYDYNVGEVKGIWIPMFYTGADGKSFANRSDRTLVSKSINDQKVIIDQAGSNARFLGGSITIILRDLFYGLYKSTDVQKHGGYGESLSNGDGRYSNRILSNNGVSGFYGSRYDNRENKALHSIVLFTYDNWLNDPYFLIYYPDAEHQQPIIKSTYRFDPFNTYTDNTFIGSIKKRGSGYGASMESLENDGQILSIADGTQYNASNTTGICDYHTWTYSSAYVNRIVAAARFGTNNSGEGAGPENIFANQGFDSSGNTSFSAAGMLIPPAGYSPS